MHQFAWSVSGRLNLRRVLKPQVDDRLFPNLELLNFSRNGRRKTIHKLPVPRRLEMRERRAAELTQLVLRRLLGALEFDPSEHLLAPPRVRHADDLHLRHRWVLVQSLFDLARINVFAAADN